MPAVMVPGYCCRTELPAVLGHVVYGGLDRADLWKLYVLIINNGNRAILIDGSIGHVAFLAGFEFRETGFLVAEEVPESPVEVPQG